ncbi:hypothetical protein [Microbacterium sp. A84]|uniref:hypothetical protein n=1 Tax=Microbacterium sp. A84 TaxID=3450715 RepID=UPI003F4408B6
MNRTRSLRVTAIAILALTTLPLSGCLFSSIPSEAPSAEEPISTPSPSEEATVEEPADDESEETYSDVPATLSFADGALLPDSTYIEWADGLMFDDGWEITTPDTGNGTWGYTTTDGTCTASFWQGTLDGLTPTGDDSADTDAVIAFFLDAEVADVTAAATNTELSYQVGGAGGLDARSIGGQQDDDARTWSMTARAFGHVGAGVYTLVDCTGGDFDATVAEVIAQNAIAAY